MLGRLVRTAVWSQGLSFYPEKKQSLYVLVWDPRATWEHPGWKSSLAAGHSAQGTAPHVRRGHKVLLHTLLSELSLEAAEECTKRKCTQLRNRQHG